MIQIERVSYGSEMYEQALALRYRLMRQPLGMEFTEQELARDQSAIHFVARHDDTVIGCVIGQPIMDCVKIRQMVVAEAFRGQGVGVQLLQALEQFFMRQKVFHAMMHARLEAVPFYEKQGYQCEGEIFQEVGIPHQRLGKDLVSVTAG